MCLGAIDGKHVLLRKPANSGSTFFNYKRTFSIQLLAIVDHEYRFLYVDVGVQGRIGDAGVFHNCSISSSIESNLLSIPPARALPSTDSVVPYVFVADDAFPLKPNIMKPYAQRGLTRQERIFNYRLSRARRVVENAFGILAARFRVFRTPMEIQPDKAVKVVLAATVLHNYLRSGQITAQSQTAACSSVATECNADTSSSATCPTGMAPAEPSVQKKATLQAKTVRNLYSDYFMGSGQVAWQWAMVE